MTETFRTGQDMNYHRVNAGCALFESAYHGGRPIVIVVGGTSKGGIHKPLRKTEILDYTVTALVTQPMLQLRPNPTNFESKS